MYLRMVEATVKKKGEYLLGEVYAEKILTSLEKVPGCIFAGLLHSRDQEFKYISLTLWQSEKDAEVYEASGSYQKNLESVQHLLEEKSEWKIQLSDDNMVEYKEIPIEPSVKLYPTAENPEPLPDEITNQSNILRILSLKVKEGFKEEFRKIYNTEILPELKKIPGCRYAFLLDNSENDGEMISLSIWQDLETVEKYEKHGMFKQFLEQANHTLGGLYQWKMVLKSRSKSKSAVTSQDIGISKFELITGKKFV
ncbi:MAG: antibiotic biosynthesis monooxygenase [Balneolaceae bacterium]|nr:antibiotic biosynthesis monooxygenase [Balneolaceae bacterium]